MRAATRAAATRRSAGGRPTLLRGLRGVTRVFLRALRMKGFKSFSRQTELTFEPGVAVVIGPNGSGKSNIADAVMWVLGEQSPTSIRGTSMQD